MESQVEKLHRVLLDGKPHRTDELLRKVYGWTSGPCTARLDARWLDLKKMFPDVIFTRWDDKGTKMSWYRNASATKRQTSRRICQRKSC